MMSRDARDALGEAVAAAGATKSSSLRAKTHSSPFSAHLRHGLDSVHRTWLAAQARHACDTRPGTSSAAPRARLLTLALRTSWAATCLLSRSLHPACQHGTTDDQPLKYSYVRENDLPQTEQRCGLKLVSDSGTNPVSLHHPKPTNQPRAQGWLTRAHMAGQVVQPVVVALARPALEEPLVVSTCAGDSGSAGRAAGDLDGAHPGRWCFR